MLAQLLIGLRTGGGDDLFDVTEGAGILPARLQQLVSGPALFKPIRGTSLIAVVTAPCLLIGAIVQAGAADTVLAVYDQSGISGADETRRAPGAKAAGGGFDGFIGQAIQMSTGLVAKLDQSDGLGWVLYSPPIEVPASAA